MKAGTHEKTKKTTAFSRADIAAGGKAVREPLHVRIRSAVERWAEHRDAGDRLPSERELARQFGVERATVRQAVQPLVEAAVLTKRVGRGGGIFVARGRELSTYHPFTVRDALPPDETRALRMVVFENWPVQQAVWNRLAAMFNRAHPTTPVEIVWLPVAVDSLGRYREFIRREHPDLVLLSLDFARQMAAARELARLSPALSRQLRGPDYRVGILGGDAARVLRHSVPLHFSFFGVLWNEDLVPARLRPPGPCLTPRALRRWIEDLARGLPQSICLCADTFMLLALSGSPSRTPARATPAAWSRDSLELMAALGPWRDRFVWHDPDPMAAGVRFRAGRAAFYAGNLGLVLPQMSGVRFRWNGVFAAAERGRHLEPGCTCMAVPANAPAPERAERVLRFLVSAAAQEEIATAGMNAVYRAAANRRLLALLRAGDDAGLAAALNAMRVPAPGAMSPAQFVFYRLRGLHREVFEGKRSLGEATALAERRNA